MRFLSMIRINENGTRRPNEQLMQDMGKLITDMTRVLAAEHHERRDCERCPESSQSGWAARYCYSRFHSRPISRFKAGRGERRTPATRPSRTTRSRRGFSTLAVGMAAALALTRSMSALLFGVGACDPITYAE
jgi:hypothetical protein